MGGMRRDAGVGACAEYLPARMMLSGDLPVVSFTDGRLLIEGTSQADDVRLWMVEGTLHAQIGTMEFTANAVRAVEIRTGGGDDVVDCRAIALPTTIFGGEGNDLLIGSMAGDEIHGARGMDTICAVGGDDSVYGGADADWIGLGSGNDLAYGGSGNDVLSGGKGDDMLYGEDGNDRLYAGEGADLVRGNAGNDTLVADAGPDTLRGGYGDDEFAGSVGDGGDVIDGGEGDDSASLALFEPGMVEPPLISIEHGMIMMIVGPC